MSFAFSSFGQSPSAGSLDHRLSLPHSPFQGSHDDGLSSSPHVGVGPGGGGRQSYSSGSGGDREDARDLTPREVVDLARSTSRGQVGHGQAGGGHHRRTSSTGSAHSPGSLGGLGRQRIVPQAPMFPDSHQSLDEYEPVEFHPLEDDVMLPFDDRPDEVASLIAAERNRGLFKLLELALPSTSSSTAEPSEWSYADLVKYLTKTTREAASDKVWVATIRQAVQTRSEPLWEKLKGLLGIDEDDDWGEGESHLAGEQHAGSEGNSGGSIVLIEGLEEGGPDDEHDDDDQAGGDRRVSDEGDGFVTGGMFSPEGGLSASLPGSSSLGELEAIGESEEEESAAETSTSGPEKQRSTDSGRTLQAPTLPTLITTQPSPSSSFNNNASQLGLFASSSEAAKTPTGDVSPFSQPLTGFGQGSGVQTPHAATSTGSSPRLGSPDVRAPRRSFVGVSIVSSSTQADYHSPSSGPQSASASTGISPSVSSADFATSPTFPVHPPARRRTSVTRDDLQYGGNEHSDPLTERGPGTPPHPLSLSLSLRGSIAQNPLTIALLLLLGRDNREPALPEFVQQPVPQAVVPTVRQRRARLGLVQGERESGLGRSRGRSRQRRQQPRLGEGDDWAQGGREAQQQCAVPLSESPFDQGKAVD